MCLVVLKIVWNGRVKYFKQRRKLWNIFSCHFHHVNLQISFTSDIFRGKWGVNLIFYFQIHWVEEKKQRYFNAIRLAQSWLDLCKVPKKVTYRDYSKLFSMFGKWPKNLILNCMHIVAILHKRAVSQPRDSGYFHFWRQNFAENSNN